MKEMAAKLTPREIKTAFTCGGCGILAQEILNILPAAVPAVWYDDDGTATHAAALLKNYLLHYGDAEDFYSVVSRSELDRAVQEDFDPRGDEDEIRELAKVVAKQIVEELDDN